MPHDAAQNGTLESRTAPYIPFPTFISALDRLGPDVAKVPEIIDRSMFDSFSGTAQGQVMATFRFLNLTDSQNRARPELKELVALPAERKTRLRSILEAAYADVFAIGLHRASPKQLDDAIEHYNVYGATLRKAVSFFCKAAQFADIPLSPFITRRKGKSGRRKNGARAKAQTGPDTNGSTESGFEPPKSVPMQRNSRTLKLETGDAEITISVRFDPFTTSAFDRDYIFGLVDTLSNYKPPQCDGSVKPKTHDDNPFGGMTITDDDVPF
jgi:hypothetical protein